MKNNNSVIRMVVTLLVIAVVSAGAMSYVNKITKPLIEEQDKIILEKSLKNVIDADSFEVLDEKENITVYQATKNNEKVGLCIISIGSGYGGDLKIMTGVDSENKVTGIDILSHGETAGLGANCVKDEFKAQFKGKKEGFTVSKIQSSDTEIKALSGATVTSNAVTRAVNAALDAAKEYNKGGNNQ